MKLGKEMPGQAANLNRAKKVQRQYTMENQKKFNDHVELFKYVKNLTKSNDKGRGFCPAHEDKKHRSFSVNLASDRVLAKCFAGCDFSEIVRSTGTEENEWYANFYNKEPAFTLEYFSFLKKLPIDFLKSEGVSDRPSGGINFKYTTETGIPARSRYRVKSKEFYWDTPKELEKIPYGLWRLSQIKTSGYVVILEGESDTLTCIHHGYSALGIPGATMTHLLKSEYLEGVRTIYLSNEKDNGGQSFLRDVISKLREFEFTGEVKELRMPEGVKDPSELHCVRDDFKTEFESAISAATLINFNQSPLSDSHPNIVQEKPTKLMSVSQLKNLPPPQLILPDLQIPSDSISCLYGASGAGKSYVAVDLVGTISQVGTAVYVAGEALSTLQPRVIAWEEAHKLELNQVFIWPEPLNLLDTKSVIGFIDEILDLKPTLIVVDTLARCMPGADENSAKDMGIAVTNLDAIRRATKACILVVHHTGKSGADERGSTALRGACDTMIKLENNSDGLITLKCDKSRISSGFEDVQLRLVGQGESAILRLSSRVTDEFDSNPSPGQLKILRVIQDYPYGPITQKEIELTLNLTHGTVSQQVTRLRKKGFVDATMDGKKRTISLTSKGEQVLSTTQNQNEKNLNQEYPTLNWNLPASLRRVAKTPHCDNECDKLEISACDTSATNKTPSATKKMPSATSCDTKCDNLNDALGTSATNNSLSIRESLSQPLSQPLLHDDREVVEI